MRCDCNVSVRAPGDELGTRCEIKNVNSIRFVMQAIEYEARRQIEVIEDGGTIVQETRLFDCDRGETRSMRSQGGRARLPLFPRSRSAAAGARSGVGRGDQARPAGTAGRQEGALRVGDYGLSPYDAGVLVAEQAQRGLFRGGREGPRRQARRQLGDGRSVRRAQQARASDIEESPVTATALGALLDLIATTRSPAASPRTCSRRWSRPARAPARSSRSAACARSPTPARSRRRSTPCSRANADKVAEYRSGKDKLFGFFVGQVMKATDGKANPAVVNEMLKKKLAG